MKYHIPLGSEVWAVKKIPTLIAPAINESKYWHYWQVHMDKIEHKDEKLWWTKYKRITTTIIHLSEIEDWKNGAMPTGMYVFVPIDHEDWLGYILPKKTIVGGIDV